MKIKIRNSLLIILSLLLIIAVFAGCGAAETPEETSSLSEAQTENSAEEGNMDSESFQECYLVTNVYGDGQKPWYIVIVYDTEVDPSSVSTEDYEVDGYDIEAVYTNSVAELPEENAVGKYVFIELSTDYTTENYGGSNSDKSGIDEDMMVNSQDIPDGDGMNDISDTETLDIGEKEDRSGLGNRDGDGMEDKEIQDGANSGGRGSMSLQTSLSNQLSVTVQQTGSISFTNETELDAWDESYSTDYTKNTNLLVENFTQDVYTLSDGTDMMYSLYLPEGYDEDTAYPLVLFMPDATGEGSDEYLALTESLGGVIWTTEEWQEDHETIVLVPQYEESNTEDPAYTMELVEEITGKYSVDTSREYLVGQSSGTIRSIKLLIDYPDEFAGALLVAGQADSAYTDSISELSTQNIWMICSEGDARAYPGMTEITEAVETVGVEVTTTQWSAALDDEKQEQLAKEQASCGTSINWTIFDTGTVMRDDVTSSDATEHMNTWRVAYNLDTVREWLFEQSK